MTRQVWTPAQDYALAFGAAIGLSASQIAKSFDNGCTRNMVIGRCHRIGLSLNSTAWRPKQDAPPPKARHRPARLSWSQEHDDLLRRRRSERATTKEIAAELNRTASAVQTRIICLGLTRSLRHFTEAEDAVIRADYANHIDVYEIAQKLGRTTGTLRQRILHLGLTRDARKTSLAKRFGAEALAISDDPAEIRRILHERAIAKKQEQERAREEKVKTALDEMVAAITDGIDRKVAFQTALLSGATLQQVGDVYGITRERVRQIIYDVKPTPSAPKAPAPPHDLICQRCSTSFVGHRLKKYCDGCRIVVHREYMRQYQEKLRPTPEYKKYHRDWMRRSRLKAKLVNLAPTELQSLLRQLADDIGSRTE